MNLALRISLKLLFLIQLGVQHSVLSCYYLNKDIFDVNLYAMNIDWLDLKKLKYIVTVAQELSFSRAADKLYMSQPPLSQQIKKVEEQLGEEIFDRSTRSVSLTNFGKRFVKQAQCVLETHGQLGDFLNAHQQGVLLPLRLGSIALAYDAFFAELLTRFVDKHPKIEINLEEGSSQSLITGCESGRLDAAIVRLHAPKFAIEKLTLLHSEHYVLALPKQWCVELNVSQSMSLGQLKDQPYISYPRRLQPELYDAIDTVFLECGQRPNISQKVYTKATTLALVKAGLGFAIVPSSLALSNDSDIYFAEIVEPLPQVDFYLYRSKAKHVAIDMLIDDISLL